MLTSLHAHQHFHAHIYFDSNTLARATDLRNRIAAELGLQVGRQHQKLVGPHPQWSFQVSLNIAELDNFISWMEQHRQGLSVLLHADTGNDLLDHTAHVHWLGTPLVLDLSDFE